MFQRINEIIKKEAKIMIQRLVFLLLEKFIKWFLRHKYNEIIVLWLCFLEFFLWLDFLSLLLLHCNEVSSTTIFFLSSYLYLWILMDDFLFSQNKKIATWIKISSLHLFAYYWRNWYICNSKIIIKGILSLKGSK